MSEILANMSVVLGADIGEFKAAMASAKAELKGLTQFGEAMKGVGESMTMYLSLPIALAGVEAVRAFDKQTLAVAQVENGLRSTGNAAKFTSEQLQMMAAQIQKKSVYGDEEVLQKVTTQLLTFSNISGETFARTQQAAVDLSAKLGQDLQTSAIQLGKALNDPTQSLGALRRAGISFSSEQIAVIHHLQATNQLGQAQTIILGELERQYGGTAEAASKAGLGGLRQLGNQVNDLMESFGKIILEAINPFIARLSKLVAAFDELSEGTKKTIVTVLAVVAAMGPLLFIFGSFIVLLPALQAGLAVMTGSFAAVVLPILAVAAAVALAAYLIYTNWSKIVAYFTQGEGAVLFDGLAAACKTALDAIKNAFAVLTGYMNKDALGSMLDFGTVVKAVFKEIALVVTAVLTGLADSINTVVKLCQRDFAGAFDSAKKSLLDFLPPLANLIGMVGQLSKNNIGDFFKSQFDAASKAADDYYMKDADKAAKAGEEHKKLAETLSKEAVKAAKKLADEFVNLNNELRTNTVLASALPAFYKGEGGYDAAAERIKILTAGLKKLTEDGLSPASAAFQKYLKELLTLSQAPDAKMADTPMASRAVPSVQIDQTLGDRIRGLMGTEIGKQPIDIPLTLAPKKVDFGFDIFKQALQTADAFKLIDNTALAFGTSTDVASGKVAALTTAMQNLLKMGVSPVAPVIQDLRKQLEEFSVASVGVGQTIHGALSDSFLLLGETIGRALSGSGDVMKAFLNGFVSILSNFLGTFGKQLIEAGIARTALDTLLVTPGSGPFAIAAGVALVALAGVASATLSSGPTGGAAGSSGSSASYSPRASSAYTPTTAPTNTMSAAPAVVNHKIQVVLAGRDMRGLLEYETDRLGRATGGR